jgi:hypothetical protein
MQKILCAIITIWLNCVVLVYSSNYATSSDTTLLALPLPYPHGVTYDGDNRLCLSDHSNTNIYILDSIDGTILNTINLKTAAPRGITMENGNLWVATDFKLHKINSQNGDVEKSFSGFPKDQQGLTFFSNSLWVSSIASNVISQIDCDNGKTITSFSSPGRYPRGLAYDGTFLLNIDSEEDKIYYLNSQNGKIAKSFLAYRGSSRGLYFKDNRFYIVDKDLRQLVSFPIVSSESYTIAVPFVQKISMKVNICNSSSEHLTNVVLMLAIPISSPQTEILRRAIFLNGYETKPMQIITDEYGEVTASLALDFSPHEALDIQMECIARMWSFTANIATNKSSLNDIPPEISDLYLKDDELYQLNDPYISAASLLAQGNAKDVYGRATNIHNFLTERLSLQNHLSTNYPNAKTVIQQCCGNALDYSVAMVALCRVAGIPARIIAGLQPENFLAGSFSCPHFWVEVYIPQCNWVPFDIAHNDTDNSYTLQREQAALERSIVFKKELTCWRMNGWSGFYKLQNSSSLTTDCKILWSDNLSLSGKTFLEKGIPICADFDGDGKADPALFQQETGKWLILSSKDNYTQHSFFFLPSKIETNSSSSVFAADFDGDGKADPAFYFEENGDWAAMLSSFNYYFLYLHEFLGGIGKKQATADFDGDGKADPAIFSPATGLLQIRLSSLNYNLYTFATGISAEDLIPVPADYDGDQKADLAILNEKEKKLYALLSSANYAVFDASALQIKDRFLAADCDGDRKADAILYNTESGEWLIKLASQQFLYTHTLKLDFYNPPD